MVFLHKGARCLKGSITVEAVLLVPVVVMVMIALMFSSFYLHDRVVCQTVLEKHAQRQERIRKHPVDVEKGSVQYDKLTDSVILGDIIVTKEEKEALSGRIQEELTKRLWIGTVQNVSCEISGISVKANAVITTRLPMKGLMNYLGGLKEKVTFTVKAPIHNPEELVRAYSALQRENERKD